MSDADLVRVVLADANVLYSRVLRDYLLYAADEQVIAVLWSAEILREVTEHLAENVPGFDAEAGRRLILAMNAAFPYAEIEPGTGDYLDLADVPLPDDGDRHVLAAALAAEATVLCTSNTKDFPTAAVGTFGIEVMTPDELLSQLIAEYKPQMLAAHRTAVASLSGATDESTVEALRRSGAITTADIMAQMLGIE